MLVEIRNPEAVAEVEGLAKRFGLSTQKIVERVIIDAGCWMPMETLANSYWEHRDHPDFQKFLIPGWHQLVKRLPIFSANWDLRIGHEDPYFHLTHSSGFRVHLSVFDPLSVLWHRGGGMYLEFIDWKLGPKAYPAEGFSGKPWERNRMIEHARRIVAEIDPLAVLRGPRRDVILRYIEANPGRSFDE